MKEKLPGYMGGSSISKGGLPRTLGVPAGKKISMPKIKKAEKSKNPKERKEAALADNFKHMNNGGKPVTSEDVNRGFSRKKI